MSTWLIAFAALLTAAPAAAESLVARGEYLVNGILGCGNCHTPRKPDGALDASRPQAGGPLVFDEPAFRVQAPNITPDPETGIGNWSDAQIKAALVQGVRPDGTRLAPVMPYALYRVFTEQDLDAVVAYLRSLAPIRNTVAAPHYRTPMPAPPGTVAPTDPAALNDPVKRGEYLVTLGHCMVCHTPKGDTGLDMRQRGAGGHSFEGPWGVVVSRNITPHRDNGIGAWSGAEIKAAITQGKRPDGTSLKPPMPYALYARMSEQDLDAVVTYLRTIPAKQ